MSARPSRPRVMLAEVLLGLIPATLLLLYCAACIVGFIYLAAPTFSVSDLRSPVTWFLLLAFLIALPACLSLLAVFRLRYRQVALHTLSPKIKMRLSIGLICGQFVAAAALLFMVWGGFSLGALGWLILLYLLLAPAVIAVYYLQLLRSGGST